MWVTIIAIICGLLIDYFISKEFKKVAELKGYTEKRYFWITFLLGLVGMLLIIALPDLKNHKLLESLNETSDKGRNSNFTLPEI